MATTRNEKTSTDQNKTNVLEKYKFPPDYPVLRKRLLDTGTYARVYSGFYKNKAPNQTKNAANEPEIVIKEIQTHSDANYISMIENECEILSLLTDNSPQNPEKAKYIIKFFGYIIKSSTYNLIVEYMNNGTFHDWIWCKSDTSHKRWEVGKQLLINIASGLSYIHENDIIHCDIKPKNILLHTNGDSIIAKINDFGLSFKTTDEAKIDKKPRGSYLYIAPEIINETTCCTKESDVFSFGMTIWEMAEQTEPYPGVKNNDPKELKEYINIHGCEQSISNKTPPKIENLIRFCLRKEPSARPTVNAVLDELKTDINTISLKL